MNVSFAFRPKLADTLKNYSKQDFLRDLVAGITVGIVALPLAMAVAIANGLKPEAGIFTAVICRHSLFLAGWQRGRHTQAASAFCTPFQINVSRAILKPCI
jgi:sulfate permease, SulP family